MATTLGLDIGTNSIGWAMMNDSTLVDMGVVIFPAGRDDNDKETQNQKRTRFRGMRKGYDRYKQRRAKLIRILGEMDMLPSNEMWLTAPELFGLRVRALDGQIKLSELGRIILHLNQRRGFKSNKKEDRSGSEDDKKKLTEYKQTLEDKMRFITANFRTVGEYFYSLFNDTTNIENWHNPNEPIKPIRNQLIYRKLYVDEFNLIWDTQAKFYPNILTEEKKIQIRDFCLYYQRPLKSQKHLVGFCTLEPQKRTAPKSSIEFQEMRMWQGVLNLTVTDSKRTFEPLTPSEREQLVTYLKYKGKVTKTEVKKCLKLESKAIFNEVIDMLYGNTTLAKLANALGQDVIESKNPEQLKRLWHTVYFAADHQWLEEYAVEGFNLTPAQSSAYSKINLEDGYGSLSTKAIKNILPFMKDGNTYDEACRLAGYHHSQDQILDNPDRILQDRIERNSGKRKDFIEKSRNPVVRQSLAATARLVNAIIDKHGRPDTIRLELVRDLKKTAEGRTEIRKNQKNRDEKKQSVRELIREGWGWSAESISEAQIRKYLLWEECNMISPYTGNPIPKEKLFTPEIQVDHIIPQRRSMDNSYMNFVLCEAEVNIDKGNKTPYEYFGLDEQRWQQFKSRIKDFPESKFKRLIDTTEINKEGFRPGQLEDTGYIAREARKMLKTICYDVRTIGGSATALLRKHWALNNLLGSEDKNRDDSRHHAIDALIIANTTDYYINLLNRPEAANLSSRTDQYGRLKIHDFPQAFDRSEVEQKVNQLLIAFKSKKRLLTKKVNKYVHSRSGNQKIQESSRAPRGPLHEDTVWGQIQEPVTGTLRFVVRKSLASFDKMKQVESIVDPAIKKIIRDHINANGGESKIKEAMKLPVYMISNDGKKTIPVKSARIFGAAGQLIQLRPNLNPKLFVKPGNNYCIAIYEHPDTRKRKFQTVNFFEATQRSLKGEALFPKTMNENYLLKMVLQQGDLVVTYENHPDEIDFTDKLGLMTKLFIVKKFDKNGVIGLAIHINPGADPNDRIPGIAFRKSISTLNAVKVRISTLGEIIPIK